MMPDVVLGLHVIVAIYIVYYLTMTTYKSFFVAFTPKIYNVGKEAYVLFKADNSKRYRGNRGVC